MERVTILLVVAVALAGCSSYADRGAATCSRLGAPPGSPNYWPCVQQQQAIDAQDRAMWGGVAASGAAVMSRPAPQPWTASCSTVGGTTFCSGR